MSPQLSRKTLRFLPNLALLEDRSVPATHFWTGAAGDGLWSTNGNWDVTAPTVAEATSGSNIILNFPNFPSVTNKLTTQDIPGLIVDRINFETGGYTLTISKTLQLRNGFDGQLATQIISSSGTNLITGGTITNFTNGSNQSSNPEININGGTLTIASVLADTTTPSTKSAGFVSNGVTGGSLVLSGANTFTGNFTVIAGTVVAKSSTALGTVDGRTDVNEGTTLDVQANIGTEPITFTTDTDDPRGGSFLTTSAGTGTIGGTINLNFGNNTAENFTLGGAGNQVITGNIVANNNSSGLIKVGAGKTTYSGISTTFSGQTLIFQGILQVDGKLPSTSTVTVAPGIFGATLAGNGQVGLILSPSGAIIAPGLEVATTPITLTANGGVNFGGSTFAPVISGTTGGAADKLAVIGTVSLGGAELIVTRNGAAPAVGKGFTLIDNDSTDAVGGTFKGLAQGATLTVNGQNYTISYIGGDGNDVVLTAATAPVTLAPTTLPTGSVGIAYNQTITASGPTGPFTFAVTSGTLPAGLTLTTAGVLSGLPTTAATSTFTITATNPGNLSGSQAYTLLIAANPVVIAPTTLPNGQAGVGYTQTLTATGPTGPYAFTVTAGTLPAGLTLSTIGVLAGTPTVAGASNFTVTATSGTFSGTRNYTLTVSPLVVSPPPPVSPTTTPKEYAVGGDVGSATATLYNPDQTARFSVSPFGGTGGVRVASADFNKDGIAELVVGTGPGQATSVIVYDGFTKAALFTIAPFEATFTGGVYVTAGDVNNDGFADLVITPDEGGGPRVRIFSGNGFKQIADFFGIEDPNFRGGARAAIGDINGDKFADLVVAAGFGGGPRIAGFSGRKLTEAEARGEIINEGNLQSLKLFGDFLAFEPALRNGTFVASGDVDGDGKAELIAGGGPGGGPRVTIFTGADLLNNVQTRSVDFFAGDDKNRGGVRVSMKNLDTDNKADLVVGAGTGAGSRVTAYAGKNLTGGSQPVLFQQDAIPGFTGGVFVG